MTDNINRTKEGIHGFTQTECDEMIASIGVGGTKMLRMTWSSFLNNFNKSLDAWNQNSIDIVRSSLLLLVMTNENPPKYLDKILRKCLDKIDELQEFLTKDKPTTVPNLAQSVSTNISAIADKATLNPLPKMHNDHASY